MIMRRAAATKERATLRGVAWLVAVALTSTVLSCGSSAPPSLTILQVRSLIPEASGMDPAKMARIVQLGAAVTAEDILEGGVHLTDLLMATNPESMSERAAREDLRREWWLRDGRATLPRAFAEGAGEPIAGTTPPLREFVTLLRPEFIEDLRITHADESNVVGVVTFRRVDDFGGSVQWTARRAGDGWRIVEFRLPVRQFGVRLESGQWRPFDEKYPGELPWRRNLRWMKEMDRDR